MTAIETFDHAVQTGNSIPVAFPITQFGDDGLAAQGVPYVGNPHVQKMAFSADKRDRVKIAILAINFAMGKIQQQDETIKVPV